MRRIRLSDTDLELFDIEIGPTDYLFYQRHKDAFKTMWREQGKPFWTRFQITFRSFTVKHGIIKQMNIDSPKFQNMLDQAFIFIHEHFVDGKESTAKNFIDDVARLAQNQDKFPAIDSKSYAKDPFFARDTRDLFRKFFGLPDQKSSYLKVYILSPVYLRFGGSVCRCLIRWMEAPQMDDPNDDSYWVPPQPNLVDKSRDETIETVMCSNCVDDCGTRYFREKIMGSKKGPTSMDFWTLGDPRFKDEENPLFAPHLNPDDDWRDLLTVEMFRDFYNYAKFKYGSPEDKCKECQHLKKKRDKFIRVCKQNKKKKKQETIDKEELIKDLKEVRNRIDELEEDGELHSDYEARIQDIIKDKPRVREALEEAEKKEKLEKLRNTYPDELDNDPYVMSLYQAAIQNGSETDNTIRVNVVGNFAQGKTSLVRRLMGQAVEGVESTNSVEINRCKFSETSLESLFSFVCKGGHNEDDSDIIDRLLSVTRKANQDTFVTTTDDRYTFRLFDRPRTHVMMGGTYTDNTEQDPVTKVEETSATGHTERESTTEADEQQIDIEVDDSRQTERKSLLTTEEIKRYSSKLKQSKDSPDCNTSPIDLWDFGGQYIFYATHMMFHSQKAIYLLVFKLTATLDEIVKDEEFPWEAEEKTVEYYMKFWMNSIRSFVGSDDGLEPPIYLVGTHFDQVEGDMDQRKEKAESYFEKVRELFDGTNMIHHIQPVDFKIDNTDPTDSEVIDLRHEIVKTGRQISKSTVIPARWLPLERALKQISKEMKIVSLKKVIDIDSENEFPLADVEQIKLFLSYHHVKGTFFYFDEEIISDYIVLDPQYVIDAFKCIITSQKFCKKKSALRELWHRLRQEARLEHQLIDKLWNCNTDQKFIEHKNILLQFLQRHHILSEAMEYDENSQTTKGLGWYIVPSLLKDHSQEDILRDFLKEKRQTAVRFVMSFRNSPVYNIIYHRLLAALLGRWSAFSIPGRQKNTLLYKNLAVLRITECSVGLAECKDDAIEFWVVNLCLSLKADGEVADRFRRFAESSVMTEYRRLKPTRTKQGTPYIALYRCNHKSHGLEGSVSTEEMGKLDDKSILPCPDFKDHDINTAEAKAEWFREDKTAIIIPDTELTAKQLSRISQALGDNWEMLGLELGVTDAKLQQISEDNRTTAMRKFRMLMAWQDLKGHAANMNTLVQALKNVKAVHVEWDEIHSIIDNI